MGTKGAVTVGLAAGPIAWSVMLIANYALTKWACGQGRPWLLDLITGAALAATAGGAASAWRALRSLPADAPSDGPTLADNQRFMGLLGLALSALIAFALIAAAVPPMVIDGCQ